MGTVIEPRHRRPRMRMSVSLTAAVTLLGIAAVWLLAVPLGPEACALTMPGPRNCFVQERTQAAIAASVAVVMLGAVIVLIAVVFPRSRRLLAFVGPIVVLIASVAAYLSAAWIPAWAFPWLG